MMERDKQASRYLIPDPDLCHDILEKCTIKRKCLKGQ